MPAHRAAFLAVCLAAAACSSGSKDDSASASSADGTTGAHRYTVPQVLADGAVLARVDEGRVVIRLHFKSVPNARAAWSDAEQAIVSKAAADLANLEPGTTIVLPATSLPRAKLPASFVSDATPGSCSVTDLTLPPCKEDPSTQTVHVPPGDILSVDGMLASAEGPNTTGGVLTFQRSQDAANGIDLIGDAGELGALFDNAAVASPPTTDADGFVGLVDSFAYDFSGKTLYEDGPVSLRLATGKIAVTPRVRTSLVVSNGRVDRASLVVKGDLKLDAGLALTVASSLSSSIEKNVDVTLFESESPLPPVMVGAVPVAESVKLALLARCSVKASASATLAGGASIGEVVTIGGHYTTEQGFGDESSAAPPTMSAIAPKVTGTAETSASCEVEARFTLLVYGVIGPYVSCAATATLSTQVALDAAPTWTLDGTVAARVGLESELHVPGLGVVSQLLFGKSSLEQTLYSKSYVLANGP